MDVLAFSRASTLVQREPSPPVAAVLDGSASNAQRPGAAFEGHRRTAHWNPPYACRRDGALHHQSTNHKGAAAMATFGSKSQHMQANTEKFVWGAA